MQVAAAAADKQHSDISALNWAVKHRDLQRGSNYCVAAYGSHLPVATLLKDGQLLHKSIRTEDRAQGICCDRVLHIIDLWQDVWITMLLVCRTCKVQSS